MHFVNDFQFNSLLDEKHWIKFTEKVKLVGDDLAICFQQRMKRDIDANFDVFAEQNNKKRKDYFVSLLSYTFKYIEIF